MFTQNSSSVYVLKQGYNVDNVVKEKLENCYNCLHNNRHTLFHFGIIIGQIDSGTRLLRTKAEANQVIKDTLKIINNNYII